MATAESASKICVVCGQDVAGKPRVKDAAGRYMCAGACQEKAAAAAKAAAKPAPAPRAVTPPPKAPPVAKPAGEGSVLGDLISSSPMLNSAMCSECGNPMPGGAVICTRCGFNTQTGKALKTAVIKEKAVKEPKAVAGKYHNKYGGQSGPGFWKCVLVYSAVLSACSLLVFAGPTGFWLMYVILIIAGFITWIANVIAAFRNDQTLWGILLIVPFVNGIAAFIFNLIANEDTQSRAMYWSLWIGGFVMGIVVGIAAALGVNFDMGSQSLSPFG